MNLPLVTIMHGIFLQVGCVSTSTGTACREDELLTVDGQCQTVTNGTNNGSLTPLIATTTAPDSRGVRETTPLKTSASSPASPGHGSTGHGSTGHTQYPWLSLVSAPPSTTSKTPSETTSLSSSSSASLTFLLTTVFPQPRQSTSSKSFTVETSSPTSATAHPSYRTTTRRYTSSQKTMTTTTTTTPFPKPLYENFGFYSSQDYFPSTAAPVVTRPTVGGNSLNEWFEDDYNYCPPGYTFISSLGCQEIHNGAVTPPWTTPPPIITSPYQLPHAPTPQTEEEHHSSPRSQTGDWFRPAPQSTTLTSDHLPTDESNNPQPSANQSPPPSPQPTLQPVTPSPQPPIQPVTSLSQATVGMDEVQIQSSSGDELATESDVEYVEDSLSGEVEMPTQNVTEHGSRSALHSNISSSSKQNQDNPTLNCSHLLLDNSTFFISQNGSVTLKGLGVLNDKDFRLLGSGMLQVCVRAVDIPSQREPIFNRREATVVLTNLCLVSSQVFLLLTFTLHCCFYELRNLPGLNLMFLSLSLFMAHAIFFFGSAKVANKIVCKIIGVFLHYFWLSAFAWLNICSFHTFRVFWFIFTSRNLETKRKVIIIRYCLIGFGIPAVTVMSFILGNYFKSEGASIGYSDGSSLCFSSPGLNRYIGLLVPAGLTVLVSLILFILTLTALCRTTSNIRKSSKTDTWAIIRYIKLSSITGFSWIFGFLQLADRNNQVFPYIYIILTGFQGVFIFLAFMVNRRVYTIVSRRCRGTPAAKYSKSTSESNANASI